MALLGSAPVLAALSLLFQVGNLSSVSVTKGTTYLKSIPKSDRISSEGRYKYSSFQGASHESLLKAGHYRK